MGTSAMLHVRLDERIKDHGNAVLAAMGLSAADAVRLLYHRLIADQAFPLELKVPNSATKAAMVDAEAILSAKKARFEDGATLVAELETSGGE